MYVIRRRPRDGTKVYAAAYLHRDGAGIYWVPNTWARARHYATRAEADAALEILIDYLPDTYLLDCTPADKET